MSLTNAFCSAVSATRRNLKEHDKPLVSEYSLRARPCAAHSVARVPSNAPAEQTRVRVARPGGVAPRRVRVLQNVVIHLERCMRTMQNHFSAVACVFCEEDRHHTVLVRSNDGSLPSACREHTVSGRYVTWDGCLTACSISAEEMEEISNA